MKKATPGMVVGIPVTDSGRFRAAKIPYRSNYFRNLILIAFHRRPLVEEGVSNFAPAEFSGRRVYTGAQIIRMGRWTIIGASALTQDETSASLRVVAGDVWLGDQVLRTASDVDLKTLPKMDAAGAGLVEKWAKE